MFDKETEFLEETRFLLLAGILAGFALRLFHLGAESFWYDETVSVYLARLPLADMLAHAAGDIHPPGYYVLLHLWQQLTAPSLAHGLEFLYAWPSLAAGLIILVLTYALGRRLFDARTGLVALWLAAFNPFQLWYSQEVRMYTVGAALALLTLWAALRVLDRRRPAHLAGHHHLALHFSIWASRPRRHPRQRARVSGLRIGFSPIGACVALGRPILGTLNYVPMCYNAF